MSEIKTAKDLYEFLGEEIRRGNGEAAIFFDTEARQFHYHMAQVGYAYYESDPHPFIGLYEQGVTTRSGLSDSLIEAEGSRVADQMIDRYIHPKDRDDPATQQIRSVIQEIFRMGVLFRMSKGENQ